MRMSSAPKSTVKLLAIIFGIIILVSFCIDCGNSVKSGRKKLKKRDEFGCVQLNFTDKYRRSLRKELISICDSCQCEFCDARKCKNYCFTSLFFERCIQYFSKSDKKYYKYAAQQLDKEEW